MFGKMLNSYYYGKSGKGDFRKENLPKNRWQLFWEMLRIRLAGLFRLNLMTAVVFLPLMYVIIVLVNTLFNHLFLVAEVAGDVAAASAGDLEVYRNSAQEIYNIFFSAAVLMIPCIAITGPFQAGMAWVTRNWARDEHAFVWSDFRDAVKENWKQALGISAITGFMPLIMLVCYQFYGGMSQQNVLFVVPQMLTLALGLIWFLSLTFIYPMLVTYKMSLGTLLRNGLLLAVGRLPQTAAIRLVMLFPILIAALVVMLTSYWMYAVMALMGYYLLIGSALSRFSFASYTNAVFDRFINPNIAGARVNRGLSDEPDDEADDEAEETQTAGKSPDPTFSGRDS